MKRYKSKIILCLTLVAICCLFLSVAANMESAYASDVTTVNPSVSAYELGENSDYDFEGQTETTSFAYGKSTLGVFSVTGKIDEADTYRNKTAYGVSSNLSFSYSYDGFLQGNDVESWNIYSDSSTSVAEYNISGSVGEGVLLVQTSNNGSSYTNAANPVTDFFKNKKGTDNFYTTDGESVAQGMFYRVIIAYKTCRKTGTTGFWPFLKDVYEYKSNVEVYEFFVCRNDAVIAIHNLSVDEDSLQAEGFTTDMLKHGETLVDGATTTAGFSIDKLGTSYLVAVVKDGGDVKYAKDNEEFTENGKYTITVITRLGKTKTHTIYVFNGGEDKGFSTYFDDYIVHGHRVYRNSDYPTYARNSIAYLSAISEGVPTLLGSLENKTTGEVFTFDENYRNAQSIPLTAGEYQGVFYSGNAELSAGSLYRYSFTFEVIDEDSAPYVNYYNLMNTQNLEDLGTKHYEVAYPMTHGGYIFVCFSLDSYKEAFSYAYEIEGRFIEKAEDGGLYYKSEKNPNNKVKYYDPIELTRVRNLYAKQNVEYNYFNATDAYTYRTLENTAELEDLNLSSSVKVFASAEEKNKLINRQPFINNFSFIKVADFDVTEVKAYCYKNGKTYSIEFGKAVSEQLTVSSKYKITETNKYGDTKEYDVYLVLENLTKSQWEVSLDGKTETIEVASYNLQDGVKRVTADSIQIKSISNEYDANALVTIKAPNVYSFEIKCLLSELKDVELYKQGEYEIRFIDRLGNSYKMIVNITGKTRYSSLNESSVCYTAFYNSIYLNAKSNDEEIIVDIEVLKELIDTVVDKDKYTSNSYNVYKIYLQEAEAVYNNPNATQAEINEAAKNLKAAIENLVASANKTELSAELSRYERLDKEKYTSASMLLYTEAYNVAKRVYADDSASSDDVSNAVSSLKSKYSTLVLRGDKTELVALLKKVKATDCQKYTPNSIEALDSVFDIAYDVYNDKDAIQSVVDQSVLLVQSKVDSLILQADFSSLETLIQKVKQVVTSDYNKTSIARLKKQYGKACEVYDNRNSTQAEVNLASVELQTAYSSLIEIGHIDELRNALLEIKDLKWFLYSSKGVSALKAKYDEAITLLNDDDATASKVESAIASLTKLKSELSIRNDKSELYEYLTYCENVDLSNKSDKTSKHFSETYNKASSVLLDLDASEEDVAKSIEEMKSAESGLEKASLAWWVILLIVIGSIVVIAIVVALMRFYF